MQSVDDLNAAADLMATLYDEVALLTSESLDGDNIADGGDPLPLTYGDAGDAGPLADHVAVDGIAWSGINAFTLAEVATHVGFLRGGIVHNTRPLPSGGVGPGSVPYVHGIGPSAQAGDED